MDLDDETGRCPACNDLNARPWVAGGFISQFEYADLKASAESCMYCSILLEGIANSIPDAERQIRLVMAFRSDHATDLFRVQCTLSDSHQWNWNGLHFYVDSADSPLAEIFKPGQDLGNETDCVRNLADMEGWVATCDLDHSCYSQKQPFLPTRLLDVLRCENEIFLCDGREFRAKEERYCALSHCWGGMVPIRTTTSTIDAFRKGIALSSLPKTFREAVSIARRLKCRFLWIDSLCIIQDNADDWKQESIQMGEVYGKAYVTIAATDASNSDGGLFFHHEQSRVKYIVERRLEKNLLARIHVRPAIDHSKYFQNRPDVAIGAPAVPLLDRCWCFQEYLLSPRVISFAKWELLWECRHTSMCNCNTGNVFDQNRRDVPATNLKAMFSSQQRSQDLQASHRLWDSIFQVYSRKRITFDQDKLVAISAIAKEFTDRGLGRYLSGLWESTLTDDLFWNVQQGSLEPEIIWAMERTTDSTIPSWSWMSVKGPTESVTHPDTAGIDIVELRSDGSGKMNSESLTEVIVRELLIKARLTEAVVPCNSVPPNSTGVPADVSVGSTLTKIRYRPDVISDCHDASQDRSRRISIMWGLHPGLLATNAAKRAQMEQMGAQATWGTRDKLLRKKMPYTASGIVLERTKNADDDGIVTFRRIGYASASIIEGSPWEGLVEMEPILFKLV